MEKMLTGGSLDPGVLRNFLYRLRNLLSPRKLRFFGVGEYGDVTWRPHFHLSLFGLGVEDRNLITDAWSIRGVPIGFLDLRPFSKETAQYTAGYVVKKLTKKDDPMLEGRYPEFCRMSTQKPMRGIGAPAMKILAESLKKSGIDCLPSQVRIEGKLRPLGRYLTKRLAIEMDMEREYEERKIQWLQEADIEMSDLLRDKIASAPLAPWSRKTAYVAKNAGKVERLEGRHRAVSTRRNL